MIGISASSCAAKYESRTSDSGASAPTARSATASTAKLPATPGKTEVAKTDAGTPSNLYCGQIAEIVLFDSVLGTTDRQHLEQYMKTRYGIP